MATYKETAKNIVKEAISSAIYIDENAMEPFEKTDGSESEEEKMSMYLFNSFKDEAISLSVLKYTPTQYTTHVNYIFQNRDIVLLDWELEGAGFGGEKALEILSEIVCNQHHIHFCAIYTAEKDKDKVLKNIISYFSNTNKTEYEDIKLDLESNLSIIEVLPQLNQLILLINDKTKIKEVLSDNVKIANEIHKTIKAQNKLCSLVKCAIAFDDSLCKSNTKLPCLTSFDEKTYTLIIENTIIQILNKQETAPDSLINSLSDNIANYKWGVMQLLGLEMQNISRKKSSFVSSEVLHVSKNTLAYYKKNHGKDFPDFIRNVLIEQNAVNLRNENLLLVESIEEEDQCDSKTELIEMNVFYNSTNINPNKNLSFGDVFKVGDNEYYICITALCDCTFPKEKINNSFFFAKGFSIKPKKVMESAETGFVSFIDEQTAVKWTSDNNGIVPYIKPICFTIPNNVISGNIIKAFQLDTNGERKEYDFQYVTTIKQNYAQRIANHAFAYPIRVGVDFVKFAE